MAGVANDYLIYPIMDLIKAETKKAATNTTAADPFAGTPSVLLIREHPLDAEKVTGAHMLYESGYVTDIYMTFGCGDDMAGVPVNVDSEHADWEYYTVWRLGAVNVVRKNPAGATLENIIIGLNYDEESGLLKGTTLTRI
ncbi:hypothetical protein [Paenibacillus sp. 22594]|uniref:hypothetical protein n=1 Tax=Paenibacillus sp. 22594 TaxID=3453947 RepID=UPI003F858246